MIVLEEITEKIIAILELKGELSFFQLKIATGLTSNDVYYALKHLAKNEKVKYRHQGNTLRFYLNKG